VPTLGPNPPDADFIGNPLTGPAPLTVQFTDQSTNNPIAWAWDFGDGGSSREQNPVHVYVNANSNNVILKVSGDDACMDEITKGEYVTISLSPAKWVFIKLIHKEHRKVLPEPVTEERKQTGPVKDSQEYLVNPASELDRQRIT
jgi:PKD repeat protein